MVNKQQNIVDEIKNRFDLVAYIDRFVPLKRAGVNFNACCPFHKEKTASFVVSPAKQIFHCFGCHEGGNIVSFVMKHERLNFNEAIEKLAKEAKIDLSKFDHKKSVDRSVTSEIYRLNQMAETYYHENLLSNSSALHYFESRKIDKTLIEKFKLGYSNEQWDSFFRQLQKSDLLFAEKSGLIIKQDNKIYDRFRHRIMFPIRNISHQVIGFGGRRLDEKQNPKYLNSPESEIYNKRMVLYGIDKANDSMRKENACILVEGYMDLLRCHQMGIENVIASSGTALTEHHARIISRYCKTIYLLFDSDEAGLNATIRSIPILLAQNLDIRIVPMPRGADPDTVLLKKGKEAFIELLGKSTDFIDFQIRYYRKNGKLKTNQDIAALIRQIQQHVAQIKDPVLRDLTIHQQLRYQDRYQLQFDRQLLSVNPSVSDSESEKSDSDFELDRIIRSIMSDKFALERKVLQIVISVNPLFQSQLIAHLHADLFRHPILFELFNLLYDDFIENGDININRISEQKMRRDLDAVFSHLILMDNGNNTGDNEKIVNETIIKLRLRNMDLEIKELKNQLSDKNLERLFVLQSDYKKILAEVELNNYSVLINLRK